MGRGLFGKQIKEWLLLIGLNIQACVDFAVFIYLLVYTVRVYLGRSHLGGQTLGFSIIMRLKIVPPFIILSGEYPEKLVNIFIQRSMTLRKRSIEPLAFLFFLLFFLIYVGTTSNLVLCFFFVFCLDLRIFKRQLDHVCNRDFHGT